MSTTRSILASLEANEFTLAYQPIVKLPSARVIGVEALLRHKYIDVGRAPLRTLRAAEATGEIVLLGAWAIAKACNDARLLQSAFGTDLRMAVNVSMPQLEHEGFVQLVENALASSGLEASSLEIEITESVLVSQRRTARHALRNLQEAGVGVALDDFGCGFANLQHLCHLHVNRLKTDRSILRSSSKRWPILDGVIALARRLNIPLVAEGIETEAQLKRVLRARCEEAQGYLFSRPATLEELLFSSAVPHRVA